MAIATNPVKVNAANRAKATVSEIVTDPETNVNTVNAMIKKLSGKKITKYGDSLNKLNAKSMNYANKANTKKPKNCFAT
jgi:hypothetical protein